MKIRDIIAEADAAPDILPQVKQDLNKGANFVKKIIDPKQWFGEPTDSSDARVKRHLSNSEVRNALNLAISGQVRQNDIGSLKQIINNVSSGIYKVSNPKSVKRSLELAIIRRPLSLQQQEELKQLQKSFY